MRNYTPLVTLCSLLLVSTLTFGQKNDWAIQAYVSNQFVFGDLDFEHPSRTISPGLGFAVQYGLGQDLRLFGDLSSGSANGGNSNRYYQTNYYQGLVGLDYDIVDALTRTSRFGLHLSGGVGWNMFDSQGFDAATDNSIARVPNDGAYSNTAVAMLGGNISYALTNQFDIVLGYHANWMYDNDWFDAMESGEANDYMAQAFVGVRFAIDGHQPIRRVTPTEYDNLVDERREAERQRDDAIAATADAEKACKTQTEELEARIVQLTQNMDSLESRVTVLRTNANSSTNHTVQSRNGQVVQPGDQNQRWRIIIGSFPTFEAASNLAAQRIFGEGEYEIVFIADLQTYRVVYKSYDSLSTAKGELGRIQTVIPDAWIIRF